MGCQRWPALGMGSEEVREGGERDGLRGGDGKEGGSTEPRRQGSEFCASPAPPHSAAGPTPGRLPTVEGATFCATNSPRRNAVGGAYCTHSSSRLSFPYPAVTLRPPSRKRLLGAQFAPRRDPDDVLGLLSFSGGRAPADTARDGSPTRTAPRLARATRRPRRPSFRSVVSVVATELPAQEEKTGGEAGRMRGSWLRCARPRPRVAAVRR